MPIVGERRAALILLLLLVLLLGFIPEIGIVKAESTIYIRANGNVEGTDNIEREGDVYTFTDSINGSIVVERDNVVVDGAVYSLRGPGEAESMCVVGAM